MSKPSDDRSYPIECEICQAPINGGGTFDPAVVRDWPQCDACMGLADVARRLGSGQDEVDLLRQADRRHAATLKMIMGVR